MSQGNGAIDNRNDVGSQLRPAGMLRELVRNGISFSARERNCCFANLQDGHFGNISVASGLDLPDDGRGIATVDWDQDGDLDVWLVNRSGPQLRFMRNEQTNQSHSVAFKLHGQTVNRDAIGARVELKLKGERESQIQTVRAGSAYLSQSSKWVHFGTGENREIEFVKVRWPGEAAEQIFGAPHVGERYHVTQGQAELQDAASSLGSPSGSTNLANSGFSRPRLTGGPTNHAFSSATENRVLLTSPTPLPPLYARSLDDGTQTVVSTDGKQATLINLWATWCQPCVRELAEFGKRYEELQSAGLSVVAVSVDGVDLSRAADTESLQAALKKAAASLPFRVVQADNRLLDQLQIANDNLLDLHNPLPIPSSFLLDESGRLVALYKGPISVEQLLRDLQTMKQSPTTRRIAGLPFAGKWSASPRSPRLLKLTLDMLEHGELDIMKEFVHRNQSELDQDSAYAILLFNIGQQHTRRGEHKQAVELYKQALKRSPKMASAYFNLGVTYAGTKQFDTALVCFEQAEKCEPGRLDTRLALARTLTNSGRANEGVELLLDTAKSHSLEPTLQFELAVTLAVTGRVETAIARFRHATELSAGKLKSRFAARFKKAVEVGLKTTEESKAAELRRAIAELDLD